MKISFPGCTKAISIDSAARGGVALTLHDGPESHLIDLDHASALTVSKAIEQCAREK